MAVSFREHVFFCRPGLLVSKLLKPLKLKLRGNVVKYVPGSAVLVVIQRALKQFLKLESSQDLCNPEKMVSS